VIATVVEGMVITTAAGRVMVSAKSGINVDDRSGSAVRTLVGGRHRDTSDIKNDCPA